MIILENNKSYDNGGDGYHIEKEINDDVVMRNNEAHGNAGKGFNIKTVVVSIKKFWYDRWWAKLLLFPLVIGLIVGVVLLYIEFKTRF